jgi:hypothetical protein
MGLSAIFLWLSLGVTIAGVGLSVLTAWRARGGRLSVFAILLTLGFAVFGLHHLIEVFGGVGGAAGGRLFSHGLEVFSSLMVLVATVYLGYSVRGALWQGRRATSITRACAGPAAARPDNSEAVAMERHQVEAAAGAEPSRAAEKANAPSRLRSRVVR